MPIRRKVVKIRDLGDGTFKIVTILGTEEIPGPIIDNATTFEELRRDAIRLSGGDRIEIEFLDNDNPYPRTGKPRPSRRKDGIR